MKFRIISALLAVVIGVSAAAQSRSGYFVDNYIYNYQLNPAFQPDAKFFVGLPGIGGLNVGINGTLGVSDVLYPVTMNGRTRTTTFMNPMISTEEALSHIKEKNRFGINTKINLLSFGFRGFGGFNTVSISAVANANVHFPKAFFRLAKEGITNTTYDIHNIGARAEGYAEIALGHSRNITKDLRVGATLKILAGAGNAELHLDRAELTLGKDSWEVLTQGTLQANLQGISYEHKYNDVTKREYVSGVEFDSDKLGLGGIGVAVDLGAEYTFMDNIKFSAAILDLGFINWKNNVMARTVGPNGKSSNTVNTNLFTFNIDDNASNSFSNELDRMKDDLSYLYQLEDQGDLGSTTKMLGATINVGAEYMMPFYRKLSFGALSSTRIQGAYTWTEFRVSANFNPFSAIALNLNAVTGTYGTGFGWMLNFKSFFIGMDQVAFKYSKQWIPLSSTAKLNMGINIVF